MIAAVEPNAKTILELEQTAAEKWTEQGKWGGGRVDIGYWIYMYIIYVLYCLCCIRRVDDDNGSKWEYIYDAVTKRWIPKSRRILFLWASLHENENRMPKTILICYYFIFFHLAVVKQGLYRTYLFGFSDTVLWCSRCKNPLFSTSKTCFQFLDHV